MKNERDKRLYCDWDVGDIIDENLSGVVLV